MRSRAVQWTMPDVERELVRRASAGDEDAFRMLVDQHRAQAYAVALRITRSPQDAEEVAQQAFVQAWYGLRRFRGDARFSTWLHRIVARRALDRATQLAHRQARETPFDDVSPAEPHAARDVLLIRALEKLMCALTPAQRAAVTLHYWQDLPVAEIATTLNMPVNTVKTHLSRARAALREAWLRKGAQ